MKSIRTKITRASIFVSLGLTILILLPLGIAVENYFFEHLVSQLKIETGILASVIEHRKGAPDWMDLKDLLRSISDSSGTRITLISDSGTVLFESSVPEQLWPQMENHLGRPEVAQAVSQGIGVNFRPSTTLDLDMVYVARTVSGPLVGMNSSHTLRFVRVGFTATEFSRLAWRIRLMVLAGGIIAFVVIIFVSRLVARRISQPIVEIAGIVREIKAGDLSRELPVRSDDEIGRLAELINEMTAKVREDIEQLKKLERFRSEFLGNVSHELRTPIFSLKGFLETLLEGAIHDTKVNKTFVEKAYHHAGRLDALLSDLIEISRIESGDMKMSFRYFDTVAFLDTVKEDFSDEARRKDQKLILETQHSEMLAFGDKGRLHEAVGNIVSNAIKYSPNEATIILRCVEKEHHVELSVTDNGPGIPEEHLSRIFERFYRVDKNRSREVGGTGLGLAIAKHIVEAHNSKIIVVSQVGKGATFSFSLKK
jgi:two-component system phosphate regulon sensor histidine kinase PhoR